MVHPMSVTASSVYGLR